MRPAILIVLCLVAAAAFGQADRPNIVLLVADDLGWRDLSCYGSEIHETPHVDALAARGVRFTDAYANAPNCAPSRACLLTGLYAPRHGIHTVGTSKRGKAENRRIIPAENRTVLGDSFVTIAELLADAGYATGHFGKWHLGDDPTSQGFEVNAGGYAAGHPRSYRSPYQNPALEDGPDGEYLTDRLADEAAAFIAAHREEPFFLYVPFYTVHTPIQGRADLVEKHRARAERDPRIKPGYAAMVESLDSAVGRITEELEKQGLTDRTTILFMSDNGGHGVYTSNAPLRGSKGMLYEGGIRVPLIAAGAGVARSGEAENVPVIGSDLFSTILELTGTESPQSVESDGRSLAPLLAAPADGSWLERPLFWHFPAYLEPYARDQGLWRQTPASAVRVGRFKLIYWYEDGKIEVFDLEGDPGESRDITDERETEATMLYGTLVDWRITVGAPIPHEPEPAYKP